jgi:hypothetical protein
MGYFATGSAGGTARSMIIESPLNNGVSLTCCSIDAADIV